MLQTLKNFYARMIKAQERRAMYWQLNNLSDRELRDLGIGRGQIREVIGDM